VFVCGFVNDVAEQLGNNEKYNTMFVLHVLYYGLLRVMNLKNYIIPKEVLQKERGCRLC
jgi:hypothetical protein